MNSSIASANNATLASVATTYALKSVVEQLSLDVAARQTAGDVAQAIATALLPMASTSDLTAAVALRTTPADVSQLIATALLPFVQQAAPGWMAMTRRYWPCRTPGPSPRQETSTRCSSLCNPPSTESWRRSPRSVGPRTWSTPRPGWGT